MVMSKALKAVALVVALIQASEAFVISPMAAARAGVVMQGGRKATPLGRTSTQEGKKLKVAEIEDALSRADLLFSVNSKGTSMKEISMLRSKLPAGAKAMVVKNTLLERAVGDSFDLGSHSELSAGVNLWFFVPQDDMRGVLEAYGDWAKKTIPKEKRDDVVVKGGFFEGDYQDAAGVAALEKLPTKLELIQKIAVSLKMAGAQGIAVRLKKAAGGKLVNAVKKAYTDGEGCKAGVKVE